ncbi:tRNA pseudouridine synthase 1 [Trapelia coarctata]|nr:tRNA pseudouridine synthase 1 [Trapelia coarctata]
MDSMDTSVTPSRASGPATPSLDSNATMDASRENRSREQARPPHRSGRGRDNPRGRGGGRQRKEMGRTEWSRNKGDRRARNDAEAVKRQKVSDERERPIYAVDFSKEDIEAEERRPKRKVAVMIGYSGSGYKGMQLNDKEKTIEGDLFGAFVAAGAVSKANANDPKKSSLVRCARTDKGVHAAGNVISMKLIIDDKDIVQRINDNLSPQIRVWGIERANSSFSAYQLCDSRIYEYLIPTHCFLPPHPDSFLGKKLVELADEAGDREGYEARQKDLATFWSETEEQYIQPILNALDPSLRYSVLEALHENESRKVTKAIVPVDASEIKTGPERDQKVERDKVLPEGDWVMGLDGPLDSNPTANSALPTSDGPKIRSELAGLEKPDEIKLEELMTSGKSSEVKLEALETPEKPGEIKIEEQETKLLKPKQLSPEETAIRELKAAYIKAKKAYRIHPDRLARIKSSLFRYIGTKNYHNYTIQKNFRDPSSKRIIKTFVVNEKPILIGDTEWLSLKVHGQSFMMHQIRKMVSMVALVVRCGCHEGRIQDSYMADKIVIPKAPGLGLLLERPVFDSYNAKMAGQNDRNPIGFKKYEKEMEEFKQREIYERIFREEERDNQFHIMFSSIDNLRTSQLLYLSSMGIAATKEDGNGDVTEIKVEEAVDGGSSDDDEHPEDG